MALDEIRRRIRYVLPGSVAVEGGRPWLPDGACSAPPATPVDRRQREFAAGRFYARSALASLGCGETALPSGADRAPIWPAGFVGSISHCERFCGAITAEQSDFASVGFDVDMADPIDHGLYDLIGPEGEIDAAAHVLAVPPGTAAKLVFVVKEAVFKAYWPLTHHFLEFDDVRIRFSPERDDFSATLSAGEAPGLFGQRIFRGRYGAASDMMFATLLISTDSRTRSGIRSGAPQGDDHP